MNRLIAFSLVVCVLTLGGCRRSVKTTDSYDLEPNKLRVVDLPAARKVHVEFSSKDKTPVTAILVSKEDAEAASQAAGAKNDFDTALKAVKKSISIQRDVTSGPLNSPKTENKTQYSILFTSKKPTTVSVRTTVE